MIGQPCNGNRDTIIDLSLQDIKQHKERIFAGKNFCVVATGDVNHNQVVDAASPWLNKLPVNPALTNEESFEKPYMTPSIMTSRDDEIENVNLGVAYIAPAYNHPLRIASELYTKILGDYNSNHDGMAHLNTANRQYNYFHSYLGNKPGITLAKLNYHGFEDIGLFTSWMHVHEIYALEGQHYVPYILGQLSKHLN